MASLIDDLLLDASDPKISAANLLRKALVVATKLAVSNVPDWIEKELSGYRPEDEVPEHRVVFGRLMAKNPARGGWIPARLEDEKFENMVSKRQIGSSIAEVEALSSRDGQLTFGFVGGQQAKLSRVFRFDTEFCLFVENARLEAIVDNVRNQVLHWAIALEKSGVRGEGLSFSDKEKMAAETVTYNFHGGSPVIGNIGQLGGTAQQASGSNARTSLKSTASSANFPPTELGLADLALQLEALRKALEAEALDLPKRVAIGALASAELSLKQNEPDKAAGALSNLGPAGRWVLNAAEQIGAPLAVAALKAHFGLPPGS